MRAAFRKIQNGGRFAKFKMVAILQNSKWRPQPENRGPATKQNDKDPNLGKKL
jgi:hypothetical protein